MGRLVEGFGAWLKNRRSSRRVLRHIAALLNDNARRSILAQPRYQEPLRLPAYGYKAFSQGDEDGILAEIFHRIGMGSRRFCEIGVGDGRENNTLALLYQDWSGTWVEGAKRRIWAIKRDFSWAISSAQLELKEAFVRPETIGATALQIADFDQLDLFSIDIDGMDWHVIDALPSLKARVVVVEYNAKFRPPVDFVIQPARNFSWKRDDYFSASLSAWERLMRKRGYALVGCGLTGANAYFVRAELANDANFCAPFTAQNHYEPARYWLVSGWESGHATSAGAPDRRR